MDYSDVVCKSEANAWDVLAFRASPAVTVGVELELQILDADGGDLVPGAMRILDACKDEGLGEIDGEFLLSMVEAKTGICQNTSEIKESLFQTLRKLRNIAGAVGFDLGLGGTHPFSRATRAAVSPGERYNRIRKRQGWMAYHEAIFGLHVHVGMPGADEAIGVMNLSVPYLPHLLALSANSPFWEGVDTEFHSARATLFRPSPLSGIPQHCASWDEFCHLYRVMKEAGIYETSRDIYWDVRPRPDFGTLEFRVCDAPATLEALLALTALIRCLVIDGLRQLDENPRLGKAGPERTWLAMENKFLAARYGLAAECITEPGGPRQSLRDQTRQLLRRLLRTAVAAGEREFLEPFAVLDNYETGAERLRRLYRASGDWEHVIDEMKNRWARELEEVDLPLER